jgi:hypothetical protein
MTTSGQQRTPDLTGFVVREVVVLISSSLLAAGTIAAVFVFLVVISDQLQPPTGGARLSIDASAVEASGPADLDGTYR